MNKSYEHTDIDRIVRMHGSQNIILPFSEEDISLNFFMERKCTHSVPCKRMGCAYCKEVRRNYFILSNIVQYRDFYPLSFLSVTWNGKPRECWHTFQTIVNKAGLELSQRFHQFLRVCGVGKRKRHLHTHYIVPREGSLEFLGAAKRLTPEGARTHSLDFSGDGNLHRILGYMYDQNFIHSHFDPEKPRQMRMISGNRGVSYGFPDSQRFEVLKSELKKKNFLKDNYKTLTIDEIRGIEYEIQKLNF